MDFGLFFLMQRDEAWTERAVYESALEQMLAAEGLGFGSVWIAEHHFNDYGLCPAPPVLASYLAAHLAAARLIGRPALAGLALAHGYDTGFWWIAGIFAFGAVVGGVLLRPGPLGQTRTPSPVHGGTTTAPAGAGQERVR